MTLLLKKLKLSCLTKVSRRYANGPNHWSVLKRKTSAKKKALQHFDDFYQTVYGKSWQLIREALLKKKSKYIAIVNNFGATEETIQKLELLGAINMKSMYEVQNRNLPFRNARVKLKRNENEEDDEDENFNHRMKQVQEEQQMAELKSVYPVDYEPPQTSLKEAGEMDETIKLEEPLSPIVLKSIEEEEMTEMTRDSSRIVQSTTGITSATLHEYIPATKIKGLDDWVLESDHYRCYERGADYAVNIEKDPPILRFPEHLKIYAFEAYSGVRFPSPRRGNLGVYDYYLMDGASVLPVLALDLQPGDTVLDMCAAPGGKSFVALQTLLPRVLVANDIKLGRVHRLNDVIDEYFHGMNVWNERLFVTNKDARLLDDINTFNKILVDVPCTTDRHVLHENDNNIFKSERLRERLRLPELQSEILSNALKLVTPGGTVVYSTCSLSPIQNDGVVQMALKKNWEETDSIMVVMDMIDALEPLRCLYKFGNYGLKYGHIVIPTKSNNWGPMYFCKIMRTR